MRTQRDRETCDTKKLFDTEFEAELAANNMEFLHNESFKVYRCPGTKHYHVSHIQKEKRNLYRVGRTKCPVCGKFVRNDKVTKHTLIHERNGDGKDN